MPPVASKEKRQRRQPAQAHGAGPPATLEAAHEALQRTEALLTKAQQIGRMGSWELNLVTGQLIWSEHLYRLLGLQPFDPPITKERVLQLAYPPDREKLSQRTRTSARSGDLYEAEVRFVLPDGRVRLFHTRSIPLADATGRITRLVGLSEDVTERNEVHDRLQRSEALLAQAEQLANMGSWEYDYAGQRIIWSVQMCRMLGFPAGSTPDITEDARDIIHPDDFPRALRDLEALRSEGRPLDNELRFITRGGDFRILHSRGVAIRDDAGRVICVRGMSQDVTGKKSEAERLQRSEILLAQAEQLANMGSWEYDYERQELSWSAQYFRMLGLEPEQGQVQYGRGKRMIHPDDRERAMRDLEALKEDRRPLDNEVRFVTGDGSIRIFHSRAVTITDEAGRVVGIRGMSQDVTDRKHEEERLRKSEELLLQAERIANFGSWEFDLKTRIPILSKHLAQMYGIASEAEWSEQAYWERMDPQDREQARQIVDRGLAECKPWEYVVRYRAPNGRLRIHFVRGVPIAGPDGKPARSFGVVQDITEQTRAEEDLRRLSHQVMRARDEEGRHAARALHDSAGQSLVALKMTLRRLEDELPKTNKRARELLESSLDLAATAMREVRTISYLMHPPMLDEAGLGLALRWYAQGFSERSGIDVKVEVPKDLGRQSQEIETTIFRIVQEALTNVHRYSGARSALIRLARENGWIRAEIRDEGRGLALPSPAQSANAPLGVGIAGMRERVQQLNGVFEFESAPGRGTTVRAILPLARGKPPAP
jgi:PAS domain S-box-containing protein